MTVITPGLILFLAMLIQAFLALMPGVFVIFYHAALANSSMKKAENLTIHFLFGVEIWHAIIFIALYFLLSLLFSELPDFMTTIFPWIMAGILFALSPISFFWYFKNRKSTSLFLSRKTARNLTYQAQTVKSGTDAFMLGFFTAPLEFIFTLPLYAICLSTIFLSPLPLSGAAITLIYIIASLIPLFTLRTYFRLGHNLAEIQRLRIRNQPLHRLIISLSYLGLAILIIILEIL